VKILLDENFPLPLFQRLQSAGRDVEHIIVLGQRGIPDSEIRRRHVSEELAFFTQDSEFEDVPKGCRAAIIISRVRQSLPIHERVEIWFRAIEGFLAARPAGTLFDLLETGELVPWKMHDTDG
jgi:hypothetical protein